MSQAALRPLTIGEILDQSFGLYRRYLPVLVTIAVVCTLLPQVALAWWAVTMEPADLVRHFGLYMLLVVAAVIAGALSAGASTLVLCEGYLGRTLPTGDALRRAWALLLSIIGISIETSLAVFLGALLLLIPGIIVACGYAVATQALMVEPGLKMQTAMSRSWALTKGSRMRVFGVLFVTGVILAVIIFGAAAVLGLIGSAAGLSTKGTGAEPSFAFEVAFQAGSIIVKTVLMPLLTCALTVTYFDLRVRAEGFDLEALAAALPAA